MDDIKLDQEDLIVVSKLGKALWKDSAYSEMCALETLSAVSLMNLTPERMVEKAATALLERAQRAGNVGNSLANVGRMAHRFYRFAPEERFVLVALHCGQWSYEKLARILGRSIEEVEIIAWSARIQLSADGKYPAGPSPIGAHCPEYDSRRPWTQKFLDEELSSGRERVFVQNHLLACDACRKALVRSRDLYFAVEKEINLIVDQNQTLADSFRAVLKEGWSRRNPGPKTLGQSLWTFVKRPDIALILLLGLYLVCILAKKS